MWVWNKIYLSGPNRKVGIAMRIDDIQEGVELNEGLKQKKYSEESLLKKYIPHLIGLTSFFLGVVFINHHYQEYPRSPLFYVIGFCSSVISSLILFVIDFIILLFTGNFSVFKNIGALYSVASYKALSAFVISSLIGFYLYSFFKRTERKYEYDKRVLVVCSCTILLIVIVSDFLIWLDNFFKLIFDCLT